MRTLPGILVAACLVPALAQQPAAANRITSMQRAEAAEMLGLVRQAIEKNYYDPDFHGVDLKAKARLYAERIQTAPTLGAAPRDVAAFAASLGDSHTFLVPPQRNWQFFYGFRWRMIGDRCFITAVRPDSDAARKVSPGDEILRLEGYSVNRRDEHDLTYDLFQLEPRGGLHLKLRAPGGEVRQVVVTTKFSHDRPLDMGSWGFVEEQLERLDRPRSAEIGGVFIWNLPDFMEGPDQLDAMMAKASRHAAVVLDLRGNPGGAVDALRYLLGYFVPAKTKIADLKGRKRADPLMADKQDRVYDGKLFVLLDSDSASAAELFARVIQLAHRGRVVGERSAGAVMEAQFVPLQIGVGISVVFGASVTAYDMIMADGKSLEGAGVVPDVEIAPIAADLAAGRDPVLARAVALAGGATDSAAAGRLFPYLWRPYVLAH